MRKPSRIAIPKLPMSCTLLSQRAVEKCICKALTDEYKIKVDSDTSLRDRTGLALDDDELKGNTYEVVRDAVISKGCKLTKFGPEDLVGCTTVGDVVEAIANDILSN